MLITSTETYILLSMRKLSAHICRFVKGTASCSRERHGVAMESKLTDGKLKFFSGLTFMEMFCLCNEHRGQH